MILLVADMRELPARPNLPLKAIVIESMLDNRRGPVATIIVKEGTLKVGEMVYANQIAGKVKALFNEDGKTMILTTHYLEEAESLCDRIAIINHGKIIQDTTKKQLLSLLNVETFIFDLEKPLIAPLPPSDDFVIRVVDSMTLEVECEKSKKLNDLFSYLNNNHLAVTSMRNRVNRLEELFVRLTTDKK